MIYQPEQPELLSYVLEVNRRMIATRSLEPLLVYALDEVLKLVGGETGNIVLKKANGTLDFRAGRTADGKDLTGPGNMLSETIVQEVLASKQPLVLSNALQHPRFAHAPSVMHYQLRSIMCVPLITISGAIGAIYLENRSIQNRFTQSSLPPLEILALQVAVAIENALLNEDLEAANQHLLELDRVKNEFIQLIAHELNTPLTGVKAYSQLLSRLLRDLEKSHPRAFMTSLKLEQVVENLNGRIQEILLMVKISSAQLELIKTAVSPADLLDELTAPLQSVINSRSLTLNTDSFTQFPPIQADKKHLLIALRDILNNAIKFTPDGGTVWVNGRLQSDTLQISISDSGIGIPVEEQTRIFDLFHGLGNIAKHTTSKHAFGGGGLGLGLPIAKGIVEAHGGTITVESDGYDPDLLPGSTFTIRLPIT
ncbi:MAG: GAF domain-containing sensor histidine kinase [Anaerolineales bacterium]|nr:GAF domain-containing sensor histidine kinase [Anaerolineales bacterium]